MLKKITKNIIPSLIVSFLVAPFLVSAVTVSQPGQVDITRDSIQTILENVLTWIYTIFFILATLFILYAGFLYMTAGGDDAKIKKAKQQLIYGLIGIAIALIAAGAGALVQSFLQ